jgi:hypothetical protein
MARRLEIVLLAFVIACWLIAGYLRLHPRGDAPDPVPACGCEA